MSDKKFISFGNDCVSLETITRFIYDYDDYEGVQHLYVYIIDGDNTTELHYCDELNNNCGFSVLDKYNELKTIFGC